jgi:sulfur relay (sulfurtransferase) DsrF/TusC family protein
VPRQINHPHGLARVAQASQLAAAASAMREDRGALLNMSESTVELHIRHSLERIDARNRSELLLLIKRFH